MILKNEMMFMICSVEICFFFHFRFLLSRWLILIRLLERLLNFIVIPPVVMFVVLSSSNLDCNHVAGVSLLTIMNAIEFFCHLLC